MSSPAITLEVLPAGFGDCLLLTCHDRGRAWRMLVDTGPDETYPQLRKRLLKLPVAADGRRHIDLFVVTHIDHDHIGGVHPLLNDRGLALRFDDMWFKALPRRRPRGVKGANPCPAASSRRPGPALEPGLWPVCCRPAEGGGVELRG